MRYVITISIILIYATVVPAFADEIEWVNPQEKTLRLKESFVRDGFLIEASDFYNNSTLITVYDSRHRLVTRNITRINDYIVINDRLNITIKNLQEVTGNISASRGLGVIVDQWVRIQTRVPGTPFPVVSIIPHKIEINNRSIIRHTYTPGSEIRINFSVKNSGRAILKNLILKINSTLPLLYGEKLTHDLYQLGAGNKSDVITVRFRAPFVRENKRFTISAVVRGNDVLGRAYRARDSVNIEVVPLLVGKRIQIKKYVSEKIYMGDIAVVSISVKNNGSQRIDNVTLFDILPQGLEPVNTNLTWNFDIGPNEQKSISYKVKPQKPGSYYFPPGSSIAEYDGKLNYNTKLLKLIVNGPCVTLVKSTDAAHPVKGQNISITVKARNTGDATAIVRLRDSVPEDYSLPSKGYTTVLNTFVLRPGNSTSVSYTLDLNDAGTFVLPQARATVLDQYLYDDERYTQRIISHNLTIKVSKETSLKPLSLSAKITSTPVPALTPEHLETPAAAATEPAPGFQVDGVLFILIIIVLIMKKCHLKR